MDQSRDNTRGDPVWLMAAGGLCASIGIVVLVGWHTENHALVRLAESWRPMAYNPAAGLLAAGAALTSLAWVPRVPAFLCGLMMLLGMLRR